MGPQRFLVESAKCLPYSREDLSLDPYYPCQKAGMVAHTYNSGAGGGVRNGDRYIPEAHWPASIDNQ